MNTTPKPYLKTFIFDLLLAVILLAGMYFRLVGSNWGEYTYMHPDERFLIWVGTDISPVKSAPAIDSSGKVTKEWISLADYFDTANSPLNPHNRGHTFYVYGTLPMFVTRVVVEWVYGRSGFQEMTDIGRLLSALADLLTVALVYLAATRLFDRRVGLLAAAFSAAAVLQIQQSHFFTMDTFINLFTFLAFYFAIRVAMRDGKISLMDLWLSLGFGVALGMAVASKLNAAPMAIALPAAWLIRWYTTPVEQRQSLVPRMAGYLALAGLVSLLTFRIGQPYAFSGPGFFGLKPNPLWIENIKSLSAQTGGDVDFPPALQWARRPVWFSFQNLVTWGLGLPLGILAWTGFLAAGWQILKGNWRRHALIWGWTALYFTWQSLVFNPTMRYQLPIYPTLAIFAGWFIVYLHDLKIKKAPAIGQVGGSFVRSLPWNRIGALLLGSIALVGTYLWAYAFTRIYVRQFTRVEASRWIYQNIPGPINLHIQENGTIYNQPLPIPADYPIRKDYPLLTSFTARRSGLLKEIYLGHVFDADLTDQRAMLDVVVSSLPRSTASIGSARLTVKPSGTNQESDQGYLISFEPVIPVLRGVEYYLNIQDASGGMNWDLCGGMIAYIQTASSQALREIPVSQNCQMAADTPLTIPFTSPAEGALVELYLSKAEPLGIQPSPKTIEVSLMLPGQETPAATAALRAELAAQGDRRRGGLLLTLDTPLTIIKDQTYNLVVKLLEGNGAVILEGSAIANEGDWDDGLPLRVDGYDGFGGIYVPDLNFNMYWDDTPEKLARFTRILDESEYILITSNRQWGTLPRLPERFPMSTLYYRSLLGCPEDHTIEWCYRVAQPGMFQGNLGFELVKTVQSDPTIGGISINTQFAEEAFTVYDHPKVLIFRKSENYDPRKVREILGAVDFSQVIHLTPKRAGSYPANLLLPPERLAEQRQGGTWSDYFNPLAIHNRFQPIGVIVWYLAVSALGLAMYPLLRLALPGLPDRGYPLARTAGMLLLSYLVWLAGSFRVPFTRPTIGAALLLIFLAGIYLAVRQRNELASEWRLRWRYFLTIEALSLIFFLAFLLVRLGNGDLWHPYFGGEKPMDFSYFNAVLKSTTFPPYDPWFSGGYLNYYYYGFVFSGVLVKFLGLVPAFALNLILPTMFSLVALGAFSGAYNLASRTLRQKEAEEKSTQLPSASVISQKLPFWAGLSAALTMVVLGNLGTLRMIFRGFARLGLEGLAYEQASTSQIWSAAVKGIGKSLAGASLPYGIGDWYWIPSRVMPPGDNAITEFPAFTFLYADPHAHLFALPVALLCLGWAIAIVLGKARWRNPAEAALGFLIGALAIGAMGPINTWDYFTYLPLGLIALAYSLARNYHPEEESDSPGRLLPPHSLKLIAILGGMALLAGLTRLLYLPYQQWFGQGYTTIDAWREPLTPLNSYLTHWGLFLFILVSWIIWEAIDWMASTPVSALRKLAPYREVIWFSIAVLFFTTVGLVIKLPVEVSSVEGSLLAKLPFGRGVGLAAVIMPLAALAGVLLLRPSLPESKRIVLFLLGTGLVITLFVELYVLRGDIGRQNTVFKLYLQAWTLFAVCAGAAIAWLIEALPRWKPGWYYAWIAGFTFLAFSAGLFTLLATSAKIRDRMAPAAPRSLDGMNYMQYATYSWLDSTMDLSQDYRAIRWMQDNVQGSPTIVEANSRDLYRWYLRFTIYTGLPSVVGWEWHQQQQRAVTPGEWVSKRVREIDEFYRTNDPELALDFLRRYNVQYIVLGQLERITYPGRGLVKFIDYEGRLWKTVYQDGDTVIYEVIR